MCIRDRDRGADFFFQLIHQVEDLRLNGYIQSCSRLIGDQDLRIAYQSHGDHDTLALSAGKLERILLHHLFHTGKTGHAKHLNGDVYKRQGEKYMVDSHDLLTVLQTVLDTNNKIRSIHSNEPNLEEVPRPEAPCLYS